jgi:hypothetical protein
LATEEKFTVLPWQAEQSVLPPGWLASNTELMAAGLFGRV